ncbi:hypothetical protein C479_09678 [Halovivax asiaticus JCM 14624]|uniref:Uncharacterized protein n=1 Tax=Halovivax asiaticus JCM 14624 TaxID=1227490 RepID=M0BJL4_9EURY|nr:hypothetical protein [Halovivax asiaticus]ELZ11071.1 hypothetical protein C479_09678 [Halovivax asiaticus JCM 14624]
MTTAYCAVCGWSHETGPETTRSDLNRAMIDHHVETGHTPIETDEATPRAKPATAAAEPDVEWTPVEREF